MCHIITNQSTISIIVIYTLCRSWLTQHDEVRDALLVAAGVGGILADVLPLIGHPHVADLDGGADHVGGAGREADSALHGRVGVVGIIVG